MKQQKECAYCGYVCEKEDMYLIDDEYYCLDCVGICDNCGSIELYDELTIVNYGRDDQRYVCSDCLNTDSFFNAEAVTSITQATAIGAVIWAVLSANVAPKIMRSANSVTTFFPQTSLNIAPVQTNTSVSIVLGMQTAVSKIS